MCGQEEEAQATMCGEPCAPESACDNCAAYWQEMIAKGYWDNERHRWTDKGWAAVTRVGI